MIFDIAQKIVESRYAKSVRKEADYWQKKKEYNLSHPLYSEWIKKRIHKIELNNKQYELKLRDNDGLCEWAKASIFYEGEKLGYIEAPSIETLDFEELISKVR